MTVPLPAAAPALLFRSPGAQRRLLWVWTLAAACAWSVCAPAAAQGLRAPAAAGDAPIAVAARVRHVTTVVLPAGESIVDVVAGDTEQWDVSAAAHLAFIRPLVEEARSNLVLLTAAGAVIPLLVVERAEGAVDAVVRIAAPERPAGETHAPRSGPALATANETAAMAERAAAAWEAVAAAEARAAERIEAARTAAQARLDAGREEYPRRLAFDYRWAGDAERWPWLVEGLWHDGQRTYLRTRASGPVLYERVDGGLEPVAAAAIDDMLHVVARVLGAGALEVGGERLAWTVARREAGP